MSLNEISRRSFLAAIVAASATWPRHAAAEPDAWTASAPPIAERIRRDGILCVHLHVPLCHEAQIACGGQRAGVPDDLGHNLYWGAVFGHDRFLSRKASPMRRIGSSPASGSRLQRTVFARSVGGAPFGRSTPVELVVVLDAHHGGQIDAVVDAFFLEAERGAELAFTTETGAPRRVTVDVVGFAGHNRMLDGKAPPPRVDEADRAPIPSFVLACRSHATFAEPLRERGSQLLVAARDLIAPEGYVTQAILEGLANNEASANLRRRAVRAYAAWQSIPETVAGTIFART